MEPMETLDLTEPQGVTEVLVSLERLDHRQVYTQSRVQHLSNRECFLFLGTPFD